MVGEDSSGCVLRLTFSLTPREGQKDFGTRPSWRYGQRQQKALQGRVSHFLAHAGEAPPWPFSKSPHICGCSSYDSLRSPPILPPDTSLLQVSLASPFLRSRLSLGASASWNLLRRLPPSGTVLVLYPTVEDRSAGRNCSTRVEEVSDGKIRWIFGKTYA